MCLVFIESLHPVSHGISRSLMIAKCFAQTKQSRIKMIFRAFASLQVSKHSFKFIGVLCEVLRCRKLHFYTAYCSHKRWKRNSANGLQLKHIYHSVDAPFLFLHLFRFGIGVQATFTSGLSSHCISISFRFFGLARILLQP